MTGVWHPNGGGEGAGHSRRRRSLKRHRGCIPAPTWSFRPKSSQAGQSHGIPQKADNLGKDGERVNSGDYVRGGDPEVCPFTDSLGKATGLIKAVWSLSCFASSVGSVRTSE